MISIVICSVSPVYLTAITESIKETIGTPYELIVINNTAEKLSLCAAYNKGLDKVKYPYICLVHEDVLFKTINWGQRVINHLEKLPHAGLIGVAGNQYKTKFPCTWPQSSLQQIETKRINIVQYYKYKQNNPVHYCINPDKELTSEVFILDGVLLATKKEIVVKHKFDEKMLKGFHGYDADFCLQISQTHKIYVVYDVLIEHFSEGKADAKCIDDLINISRKWKHSLPLSVNGLFFDKTEVYNRNLVTLSKHLKTLLAAKQNFITITRKFVLLLSLFDCKPSITRLLKDTLRIFLYILKKHCSNKKIVTQEIELNTSSLY